MDKENKEVKGWEKEFDVLGKEWTNKAIEFGHENAFLFDLIWGDIKPFISQLLTLKEREIVEKVRGMKKMYEGHPKEDLIADIHNKACEDISLSIEGDK